MSSLAPLLLLLLFTNLAASARSQNQLSSPLPPTIAQCGPSLLQLVPCAPFVQGVATSPTLPCCVNLRQIYNQQPSCLCLLLNNNASSAFPINNTLTMQLPLFCSIRVDMSTCSGVHAPSTPPISSPLTSTPPTPQVSFGTKTNSSIASSPMVTVTPRTNFMGFGFHQSFGMKLKPEGTLLLLMVVFAVIASIYDEP